MRLSRGMRQDDQHSNAGATKPIRTAYGASIYYCGTEKVKGSRLYFFDLTDELGNRRYMSKSFSWRCGDMGTNFVIVCEDCAVRSGVIW